MRTNRSRSLTSAQSHTQDFFYQCLHAFIHSASPPPLEADLALPLLQHLVEKHHLNLIFMRLFQDEPSLTAMLIAQTTVNAMMERYLRMMRGMFDVLDTLQKQAIQPIILKGIPLIVCRPTTPYLKIFLQIKRLMITP